MNQYNVITAVTLFGSAAILFKFGRWRFLTTEEESSGTDLLAEVDSLDTDNVQPLTHPTLGMGEPDEFPRKYTRADGKGRRALKHNHHRLAAKLASACKMVLTVGDYNEANKMVVTQWLKNELRQIPNRRNAHCVAVVNLAVVMVFTPTSSDIETQALMNSHALMERRFEHGRSKWSYDSGIFGWLLGHRRMSEPTRSA